MFSGLRRQHQQLRNVFHRSRQTRRNKIDLLKILLMTIILLVVGTSILNASKLSPRTEADVTTQYHWRQNRMQHDVNRTNRTSFTPRTTIDLLKDINIKNDKIVEFQHHDGAVIVTKIHGPHQLPLLKQSLCLLHHAYNKRVLYNIVVFVTIPLVDDDEIVTKHEDNVGKEDPIGELQQLVSPARLDVVVDNDGIVNEIHKLSPERRDAFLERCSKNLPKKLQPEDITWDSQCEEENVKMTRLSYNWQAEFRSMHIWNHPALAQYKYMMWIDSDAFCTRRWDRDPIAVAMKHNLAILFANYPQGRAKIAQPRVRQVFGNFLCRSRKTPNGHLETEANNDCGSSQLWTVHGFMHVTNLQFYRQDIVQEWARTLIGDCFLCRQFDDQTMVTVPAALLAPEKSWDMYRNGIELKVAHNNLLDGKRNKKVGGFLNYWKVNAQSNFPEAADKCAITSGS